MDYSDQCHKCEDCKEKKTLDKFRRRNYKLSSGDIGVCYDKICRKCYRKRFEKTNPEKIIIRSRRKLANKIKSDCLRSDRKSGRDNDLDLEFVRAEINKPCYYCKRTNIRISLDRLDSSIGHIRTNVVPSCYRCNSIKTSLPKDAWFIILKGIVKADIAGAFNGWEGPWLARSPF